MWELIFLHLLVLIRASFTWLHWSILHDLILSIRLVDLWGCYREIFSNEVEPRRFTWRLYHIFELISLSKFGGRPFKSTLACMLCLDREIDDSPSNLNSFIIKWKQWSSLLHEHKGPELGCVVLKHKLSFFQLNLCVAPRHWNVINPQITLMTPA